MSASKNDGTPVVEYIPLREYYHRHTKSIFWELEQIIPVGNNPLFRLILGWAVPPKVSFLKLTQTEAVRRLYEEKHVAQDMLVPLSKTSECLDVFHEKYEVYPLWICPYRAYDYTTKSVPHRCFLRQPENAQHVDKKSGLKFEMYVDLGAYGTPKACLEKKPFDHIGVSVCFALSRLFFYCLYVAGDRLDTITIPCKSSQSSCLWVINAYLSKSIQLAGCSVC